MSNIPLSTVQQLIERSIFESIRLELIDKGYLPDVARFPNTTIGIAAYKTAIDAIVTQKGFAIELFNEGANTTKGVKKVPRIVINTGNFLPGALGGDPLRYFEDQGISYDALILPPQTVDFYINIHVVSGSVEQERILNALLALSLPRRGYIPWYTDRTQYIFCRNINFYNANDFDTGMIEKIFAYEIPDCWDRESFRFEESIAKISEITLHPNVQKYIDGEWGSIDVTYMPVLYNARGYTNGFSIVTGNLGG